MKKVLIIWFAILAIVVSGCSNKLEEKDKSIIDSGKVSNGIVIGQKIDFTINNQFDKPISLSDNTKKVIFVFTKPTGHLVKEYLKTKPKDYLPNRDILFVADVSGMPKIIFKMFALPDFKKSNYSVLLLKDEKKSNMFKNEAHKDEVMIIELDNKVVKKVKFISTKKDLVNEIN